MERKEQTEAELVGFMRGHTDWVTCLACPDTPNENYSIISGSRDKSLILWDIRRGEDGIFYGVPYKSFKNHNHTIEDIAISSGSGHLISASWDKTLKLLNLTTFTQTTFDDHKKDVLSVSISPGNRQIVSCSRDKTIKIWNAMGDCKLTLGKADGCHNNWVTKVRFATCEAKPYLITSGHDKLVKIWDMNTYTLKSNLQGHDRAVTTLQVAPDGTLFASGGMDGKVIGWDMTSKKYVFLLELGSDIHALAFHPLHYWIAVASGSNITIWNLTNKQIIHTLDNDNNQDISKGKGLPIRCISLAWSTDNVTLYSGHTDNQIRIWKISSVSL